jgi:hypothetical protein
MLYHVFWRLYKCYLQLKLFSLANVQPMGAEKSLEQREFALAPAAETQHTL